MVFIITALVITSTPILTAPPEYEGFKKHVMVLNSYHHGWSLKGEAVSSIPLKFVEQGNLLFNHEQLRRFNVSLGVLPVDSQVVQKTGSFYDKYEKTIVTALAVFFILSFTIFALAISNYKLRKAEDKLTEADLRWRFAFENSGDGVWYWNVQTNEVEFSKRWKETLGYADHEIENDLEEWNKRIHPDDKDRLDREIKKHFRGQTLQYIVEHRAKCRDGNYKWVLNRGKIIAWTEDKKPLRMVLAICDISERIQAEEDLLKSQQMYQAVVEDLPALIVRFQPDMSLTFANEIFCDLFGKIPDELVGQSFLQFFSEKEKVELQKHFNMFSGENPIAYREHRIKSIDESIRWIRWTDRAIFDYEGRLAEYQSVGNDITELKLAEERLKESEQRWQYALEGSEDGVWDWNVQTNEIFFSKRWKEILGFAEHEIENNFMQWIKRIHPSDQDLVHQERQRHLAGETPQYMVEYRMLCKDGVYKWILVRGKVVARDEQGKPLRMIGTHTDITERKRSEEEIKYLSFHDKLTGLYNRAFFEEELKRLDTHRQLPLSIIMGDANGLKMANDVFGHAEGDILLKQIAEVFAKACRKEDIIARVGGDEFAVILPKTTAQEADRIVERIKELSSLANSGPIDTSIALGTATKENMTDNIERVYKLAEETMYNNKLLESRNVRGSIIMSLRKNLEERTHETEEHSDRIKKLAQNLGKMLGLDGHELAELELLAALHDIGKVAIPKNILEKPTALSPDEWEKMTKHVEIGYRIAAACPELVAIADYILSHHEWWDGGGYAHGLKGEDIPLIARIISVVDAYDSMTNERCYRKTLTHEQAIEELKRCSGTQFDPKIVEAFIRMLKRFNPNPKESSGNTKSISAVR